MAGDAGRQGRTGEVHSTGGPSAEPARRLGVPAPQSALFSAALRLCRGATPCSQALRNTRVFPTHAPGTGASRCVFPCVQEGGAGCSSGEGASPEAAKARHAWPAKRRPPSRPPPPPFLVFTIPPRFRFGFWDCYLLGWSHPPPRSAALGGVRAGCELRRANCELIELTQKPPLPPRVPSSFPVYCV